MSFTHENTWNSLAARGGENEFHSEYERSIDGLLGRLAEDREPHVNFIGGKARPTEHHFSLASPIDGAIALGKYPKGTAKDVADALAAAHQAFELWKRTDLSERLRIFRRAAEIARKEKFDIAASLTLNNGKNRREALGEADMGIDYMEYYASEMERNNGYDREVKSPSPGEGAKNVLLPYGAWAVVCPFNFPFGIALGMTTGVLITGNTAVVKPASPAPALVYALYDILDRAGLPPGVLNLVAGSGEEVGEALVTHPKLDGIIFTGSLEVGHGILRRSGDRKYPIPLIFELGGKNAAIISDKADLNMAVRDVVSSAFGYSGQKCVACSRVYVQRNVRQEFLEMLVSATEAFKVADPRSRECRTGPVIHSKAVQDYEKAISIAKRDGRVEIGGARLMQDGMDRGNYVAPTVVTGLPESHPMVKNELFLPILCVQEYTDLKQAVENANDVVYGLTAGIRSQDQRETDYFLDNIQAGTVFVNGVRGATNGAITGIHAFGGWKASGSTGKGSGDIYYLLQFLRQQSRAFPLR
ncbi:MAG: aldehyde dehydrogenase family protein [Methanomassiliicoccales archaeon]|nr:aldehyde dehydrogenase family protein [Methanomassiliicoccales archaeon]